MLGRYSLGSTTLFDAQISEADRPLIVGQALFGLGWGLIGYCPGPVFSSLALGYMEPVIVLLAMVGGAFLYKWVNAKG